MSNEEKLQAIRQQAKREKAERIQRDQASRVSKEDRQKRRTGIGVKELLVIPVALAVGLWLWNHYSKPEPETKDVFDKYAAIVEAGNKAVANAALRHLQREGWNINLVSEISASPLSTDGHFKVLFKPGKLPPALRGLVAGTDAKAAATPAKWCDFRESAG